MLWVVRVRRGCVVVAVTDKFLSQFFRTFTGSHIKSNRLVRERDVKRNQSVSLILLAERRRRTRPNFLVAFQLLLEFSVHLHDQTVCVLNRMLHALLFKLRVVHRGRKDQILHVVFVWLLYAPVKVVSLHRPRRVVALRRLGEVLRPRILLHFVHWLLVLVVEKVFLVLLVVVLVVVLFLALPISKALFLLFLLASSCVVPWSRVVL